VSLSWSEDGPGFGQQFLHRTAHILDVLHVWLLWLLVSEFNIGQPRYSFFNHTGMMGNGGVLLLKRLLHWDKVT
jgi:hypothetical protein